MRRFKTIAVCVVAMDEYEVISMCPNCGYTLGAFLPGMECPECGSELEVIELDPFQLAEAPETEEDWGQ